MTNEAILQAERPYNFFSIRNYVFRQNLSFIETDISLTDLREGNGGAIYCEVQTSAEAPYLWRTQMKLA